MLKVFIIFSLFLNIAFGASRYSEEDKKVFLSEVKKTLKEIDFVKNDKITIESLIPKLDDFLNGLVFRKAISTKEKDQVKIAFDTVAKTPELKRDSYETTIIKFATEQFDQINRNQIERAKNGENCNKLNCEEGLKCIFPLTQNPLRSCKSKNIECSKDTDCCSTSCVFNESLKKKICESELKCYAPAKLGATCDEDTLCEVGVCLPYNEKTIGVGECLENAVSCAKNSECCSHSCKDKKCSPSYLCKSCAVHGEKSNVNKKCCEGLIPTTNGICTPDIPPFVGPEVRIKSSKSFLVALGEFIFSSASAGVVCTMETPGGKFNTGAVCPAGTANPCSCITTVDPSVQNTSPKTDPPATTNSPDISQIQTICKAQTIYQGDDKYNECVTAKVQAAADASVAAQGTGTGSGTSGTGGTNPSSNQTTTKQSDIDNANKIKSTTAALTDLVKSDLKTCDIHLKNDYYNDLKKNDAKSYNLELGFLAFDYVLSGKSASDYWVAGAGRSLQDSIFGRLNAIAIKHKNFRDQLNADFDRRDKEITCVCKYINTGVKTPGACEGVDLPDFSFGNGNEDADGIKAAFMLIKIGKILENVRTSVTATDTELYLDLAAVKEWAQAANWSAGVDHDRIIYGYAFDTYNPWYFLFPFYSGPFTGDVAARQVRDFSAWANQPSYTPHSLVLTKETSIWGDDSLSGAWLTKFMTLQNIGPNLWNDGVWPKEQSVKVHHHDIHLNHPYNDICKGYGYASACLKNFLVLPPALDIGKTQVGYRYIIDPWVPRGVDENLLLIKSSSSKNYFESLQDSFEFGINDMIDKMKSVHIYRIQNSFSFWDHESDTSPRDEINSADKNQFKLPIDSAMAAKLTINNSIVNAVKDGARKFIVEERLLDASDSVNIDAFADYAYEYHFLRPKLSKSSEISYPPIGFVPYLDFISNGVQTLAANMGNGSIAMGKLNQQYLQNYINLLQLYHDIAVKQGNSTTAIDKELQKAKFDLASYSTLNDFLKPNSGVTVASKTGQGSLSPEQARFANAIKKLRAVRSEQLKKAEAYKKSNSQGDKLDRANRVANAIGNYGSKFSRPTSGSGNSSNPFGAGGGDALGLKSGDDNKKKSSSDYKPNYGIGSLGATPTTSSSHSANSGDKTDSSATEGARANGMSDEDAKRLADAIEARDKLNKDKFKTKEDQTLFEQVTNAYIRNYDKVLIRKKGKEVFDQK